MSSSMPNRPNESDLPYSLDYPPPDFIDPMVQAYKKFVDHAAIRENLKLTVEERLRKAQTRALARAASLVRQAELEEFNQFTSRILDVVSEPLSLEEYLRLWREQNERQTTTASIERSSIEDDAGLSHPLSEAFNHVRSQLGIES